MHIVNDRRRVKFPPGGERLVRQLLREFPDWIASRTAGHHIRLTNPTGAIVIISSTPSDVASIRSARSLMRRAAGGRS